MSNTDTSKTILLPDQKELLTSLKDIRLAVSFKEVATNL